MLDLNQRFPNVGKSEVGDRFVNFTPHHQEYFGRESDARAEVLIYVPEKGLLQPAVA